MECAPKKPKVKTAMPAMTTGSVPEIAPATSMAGAIKPVVTESARLACAAPSPKLSENTGNSGCT